MVNCSNLTFKQHFSHSKSHQDNVTAREHPPRPAQLNCGFDYEAKRIITNTNLDFLPPQQVFVDGRKITTDLGLDLWLAAQLVEAQEVFSERKVLSGNVFDQVSWWHVSQVLTSVPKMFEILACKQVFDIYSNLWLHTQARPINLPTLPIMHHNHRIHRAHTILRGRGLSVRTYIIIIKI